MRNLFKELDKIAHMAVSAVIAMVVFEVMMLHDESLANIITTSAIGTMIVGLVKEAWDEHRGGRFDWYDLLADAVGTVGGIVIKTVILFMA